MRLMHSEELYKFSDGTLTSIRNTLDQMLKNLRLGYNKTMERRKWTATYQKRTCTMIKDINQQLLHRRIMRSLEKLVGGRDYGTGYRLLQRTVFPMLAATSPRRVRFIATCSYPIDICKDIIKAQVHVSKDFHYSDTARLP
ncbi:hypothetical protein Tco_0513362 [Tanacetum coccineum]